MVLSDISIKRPVFATVLALMLIVLGMASLMKLPIREYPAIDPPVVSITTTYRGASAARGRHPDHRADRGRGRRHRGHQVHHLAVARRAQPGHHRVPPDPRRGRRGRTMCATAWRARWPGCRKAPTRRWCRRSMATPARSSGSRWSPTQLFRHGPDGARPPPLRRPARDRRGRGAGAGPRRAQAGDAHLARPPGDGGARPDRRRTSRTRSSARTSSCRAAASRARSAS